MIRAFIFIDVEGDHTKTVFKTISRVEGVRNLYMITGSHDIMIDVEAPDTKAISETILTRIRSVDGVLKTVTNIVI